MAICTGLRIFPFVKPFTGVNVKFTDKPVHSCKKPISVQFFGILLGCPISLFDECKLRHYHAMFT